MTGIPKKSFELTEGRYSIFLEDPMQAPQLEFPEGRRSCIEDEQGGGEGGQAMSLDLLLQQV